MYSGGPLHTDEQGLNDQLEPIYNSSVLIQDVAWKTCRERKTIETSGKWGPGKSVLVARSANTEISQCFGVNLRTLQRIQKVLDKSTGDNEGTASRKPHSDSSD